MKACKGRLFKRNTIRIMMEFKKYSSIENSFYKDYVNDVREQVFNLNSSDEVFSLMKDYAYKNQDLSAALIRHFFS